MKNQRDKNGRVHGLWEDYYPGGELSCRGCFNNGIYHGLWEWYCSNGKLILKGAYKRDKPAGLWYDIVEK